MTLKLLSNLLASTSNAISRVFSQLRLGRSTSASRINLARVSKNVRETWRGLGKRIEFLAGVAVRGAYASDGGHRRVLFLGVPTASMRPRRVRLGWQAGLDLELRRRKRFNEAEARTPRMAFRDGRD